MDTLPIELERHIISYLEYQSIKNYAVTSKGRRELISIYCKEVADCIRQRKKLTTITTDRSITLTTAQIIERLCHLNMYGAPRLDHINNRSNSAGWYSPSASIRWRNYSHKESWCWTVSGLPSRMAGPAISETYYGRDFWHEGSPYTLDAWCQDGILQNVVVTQEQLTTNVRTISRTQGTQKAQFKGIFFICQPSEHDIPKDISIKIYCHFRAGKSYCYRTHEHAHRHTHTFRWLLIKRHRRSHKQWALTICDHPGCGTIDDKDDDYFNVVSYDDKPRQHHLRSNPSKKFYITMDLAQRALLT